MQAIYGLLAVLGRIFLAAIFLMAAVGNDIPKFQDTAQMMAKAGIPVPHIMLAGAIAFLILGSLSLIFGLWARLGAFLLFVFLVLATYYFHNFWALADPQAKQMQMIHFMKNLSMAGAMLLVMSNGAGPWSLDARARRG